MAIFKTTDNSLMNVIVQKQYLDSRTEFVNSLIKKDLSLLILKGLVTIDHS